jgi:GNAT superfamily N-acetyltransferase
MCLGADFRDEAAAAGCPIPQFSMSRFLDFWRPLIASGTGVIICHESKPGHPDGAIGFVVAPDFYEGVVASEVFFYVKPELRAGMIGGRLFNAFEKRAKDMGATRLVVHHMTDLNAGNISEAYVRRGYLPCDVMFIKMLTP